MNRARREGETFEEYRASLKQEEEQIKQWMKGVPAVEGMTPIQYMTALYKENNRLREELDAHVAALEEAEKSIEELDAKLMEGGTL